MIVGAPGASIRGLCKNPDLALVQSVQGAGTTVVVKHDLSIADRAGVIVETKDGRLAEEVSIVSSLGQFRARWQILSLKTPQAQTPATEPTTVKTAASARRTVR